MLPREGAWFTMLDGSTTCPGRLFAAGAAAVLGLLLGACGAGTRALPDEIAPLPSRAAVAVSVDGGGAPHAADAGPGALSVAPPRSLREAQEGCSLRVRHLTPTHLAVGREIVDVLRRQGPGHFRPVAGVGGAIHGIALHDVDPGSCLEVLGFQEDDVIVEVNGFDFSTPESYRELYESMDSTHGAVVRFERGSDTLELQFDISRPP